MLAETKPIPMTTITIRLPIEWKQAIKALATQRQSAPSTLVRHYLAELVAEAEPARKETTHGPS